MTAPGLIRVGIGGWTYAPWRGVFYPPGLPAARELEHAARALTAIEIEGTFYRSQPPAVWAKWAAAAPEGFVFTVKAHRACTNRKVLADAAESVAWFLAQGLAELGDKLGPILWQLAATKRFDPDEIAGYLAVLPKLQSGVPLRHAIEPRHESFRDPAFFALARAAGVAVVFADADNYPRFDEETADFTYARLQRSLEDVPTGYTSAALDGWAERAREWASGGRQAFVFFVGGGKVRNPAAAEALIARVGPGVSS